MRTSSKMLCCWYVCTLLDYRSIYAASKIITTDPSHIKLSHWTSLLRSRCSVPMTSSLLAGCFFSHLETCLKELTTSVPHSWLDEWVWNREHKPLQSFKEAHKLILQPAVIRQVNALYLFRVYRPSIASVDFVFKSGAILKIKNTQLPSVPRVEMATTLFFACVSVVSAVSVCINCSCYHVTYCTGNHEYIMLIKDG